MTTTVMSEFRNGVPAREILPTEGLPAPSARIKRLKAAWRAAEPRLCIERAVLYTESCRNHGGDSPSVRSARAFRDVCAGLPVTIFPDELIVGVPGAERRSGSVDPELSWQWIAAELEDFPHRSQDPVRRHRGRRSGGCGRRSSPTGRDAPWKRRTWRGCPRRRPG